MWDFPGQYVGSGVKIWGEKCVNDIGRFQHDTTVINLYNSATYKLDGNKYYETIKYHWVQGVEGQTVKCLLELRNDTLIQTNNVDEAGKVDKNNYGVYKFVRMK